MAAYGYNSQLMCDDGELSLMNGDSNSAGINAITIVAFILL